MNTCASPSINDLSRLKLLFHKTNSLFILSSLTQEKCSSHWSQEIEETSSSLSELHFRNCQIQALDVSLSSVRVKIINISIKIELLWLCGGNNYLLCLRNILAKYLFQIWDLFFWLNPISMLFIRLFLISALFRS